MSLLEVGLRAAWLRDTLGRHPVPLVARALDLVCLEAEQADETAREVLVALVLVVNDTAAADLVQLLREEAVGAPLPALERLLCKPIALATARPEPASPTPAPLDRGGRALTLGERKSLARRPDRRAFDRLLRDPHPDVVRHLLLNPRLTEDDVVRMATLRPARPEVLAEIARHPRWSVRARVRLALVLNPHTSPDVAIPFVGLLSAHELRLVVELSEGIPAVRAVARELLLRRPAAPLPPRAAKP